MGKPSRASQQSAPGAPARRDDRQTDDSMWAEALNLGAYDVLAQPLDRGEVFTVLAAAWQGWWYEGVRNRASSSTQTESRTART